MRTTVWVHAMSAAMIWPVAAMVCQGDPITVAIEFYSHAAGDEMPDSGLLQPERMPEVSRWLSANSIAAIELARVRQQAFIDEYPGDKPPWIEGSLFGSTFEGFTALERIEVDMRDGGPVTWASCVCAMQQHPMPEFLGAIG